MTLFDCWYSQLSSTLICWGLGIVAKAVHLAREKSYYVLLKERALLSQKVGNENSISKLNNRTEKWTESGIPYNQTHSVFDLCECLYRWRVIVFWCDPRMHLAVLYFKSTWQVVFVLELGMDSAFLYLKCSMRTCACYFHPISMPRKLNELC